MPQHTQDEIDQRRATVAALYLKSWTQQAIADQVGVDRSQVSLDLKEIRKEWKESMVFDFNEAKGKELAKIDKLEAEYWQAWEESTRPLKRKSTRLTGDVEAKTEKEDAKKPKAKNLVSTESTEERLGDPRYLDGVMKCIQKRVDILGLDAPQKVQVEEKHLPSWLVAVKPKTSLN